MAGITILTAFISIYRKGCQSARELSKDGQFIEVFVDYPLEVCEERDPKGVYKKARQVIIKDFTGIIASYERPQNSKIHLRTGKMSVAECLEGIMAFLTKHDYISH